VGNNRKKNISTSITCNVIQRGQIKTVQYTVCTTLIHANRTHARHVWNNQMISTVRKQLDMQAKMQSWIQSLRKENYVVSGVVGSIVTTGVQIVQSPFKEFPSEMLSVRSKNYCKILSKNACVYLEYVSITRNSTRMTTYEVWQLNAPSVYYEQSMALIVSYTIQH
jgi:hypothetical protein